MHFFLGALRVKLIKKYVGTSKREKIIQFLLYIHVGEKKVNFYKKKIFQEQYIRLSNGLDPDQDRCLVAPDHRQNMAHDLDPICLQRLSA